MRIASRPLRVPSRPGAAVLLRPGGTTPPLPPRITAEYRDNTIKSFLKGDPNEVAALVDSAQGLVSEGVERVKGALHLGGERE